MAIYNGKSSWKDYLVQFDLAAHANSWDKDTKVIKFACSLRGSAQALLSDMGPDVRGGWSGGAMVLVNFQCRGVLLVWIRVGQGPTALAVSAGGGCLDIFTLVYPFFALSPSLWETTQYRLIWLIWCDGAG